MTSVSLRRVSKQYGDTQALKAVDLEIREGELLTLLGPSGCGKTTLLRLIAGLLPLTAGEIYFGDQPVGRVAAHKRNVGLVFQNYALFPHMTVAQNVAFGLRMRRLDSETIKTDVREMLDLVQLPDYALRYPHQLSGGQQQRTALARALVIKPAVLLLDEPFGALDKQLREQLQLELRALQRRVNITSVFVTHDQEEALTLSDRIAVMNRGVIEQLGTPTAVYETPESQFALSFIGVSNTLRGEVVGKDDQCVVVRTRAGVVVRSTAPPTTEVTLGESVLAAIRPERVTLALAVATGTSDPRNRCRGVIKNVVYLGSVIHYYVEVPGGDQFVAVGLNTPTVDANGGAGIDARSSAAFRYESGQAVDMLWDPSSTLVLPAAREAPA